MQAGRESKKCRKIGPYVLLKPIGKGAFSTVFEARLAPSESGESNQRQLFAVKQISLMNLKERQLERIHQQMEVLSLIKHENIISLVDYKQTAHNLYLVFEHCKFSDLNVYIREHYGQKLPEDKVRSILGQLCGAFKVIRQHKVIHRDLKLSNILVTEDFEIKLADFGFAKLLEEDEYTRSMVGSFITMAPEIVDRKDYNEKCDIWSLGVITFQMLFGSNPFFDQREKMGMTEIRESLRKELHFPGPISPLAEDLIRRMLVVDPKARMSFTEFFQHEWLKDEQGRGSISEILRSEALRVQLGLSLNKSSKPTVEKEFLMENCQAVLTFSLFEFVRNYIENSLTNWVNISRVLLDLKYPNRRLTGLALALLLDNIKKTLSHRLELIVNERRELTTPDYLGLRELQTWPMSEFSKRLPNFIAKSIANLQDQIRTEDLAIQLNLSDDIGQLYAAQLAQEISKNKRSKQELRSFVKVRPWMGSNLQISVQSGILNEQAVAILVGNLKLKLQYDELCKKCSSMFRLSLTNSPSALQQELDALKTRLLEEETL